MPHTGIFATAAQCQYKAGAGASATATAEAYINSFCSEAESEINISSNYNWSDAYAALNADVKAILQEAESAYVAMCIINYDMSGYPGLAYAQTMLDVMKDQFTRCVEKLKLEGARDFVINA